MRRYNIPQIIESSFEFDDLRSYPSLKIFIISLSTPSIGKIKATKVLLKQAKLPTHIDHHIRIRLELLEDIILRIHETYYP